MSWSVGASGKSDEVAEKIEAQFASYSPCTEPEESVKQGARKLIAEVLAANNPPVNRTVSAWGSQATLSQDGKPDEAQNTLSITIS